MLVYLNGAYVDETEARVAPDDRGFVFGDGVYDVLRVQHGRLFEEEAHWARLQRSLREVRIGPVDTGSLREIARQLLTRNGLTAGAARVYVQVTRGAAPRRHPFPEPPVAPTVYLRVDPFVPRTAEQAAGVSAILLPDCRWLRCDIKAIGLLANVMATQQAREQGAEEALLVRDGMVLEGSHTNLAAVFDGELWTAPLSPLILAGITREVVLCLCRETGIGAWEQPIPVDRLRRADELMILGTLSEVMPVVRLEGRPVGNGQPGPVTRGLQRALRERIDRLAAEDGV